jgi:hypothetical protein
MNGKGFGRTVASLIYYFIPYLEGLRKKQKSSALLADVSGDIRTKEYTEYPGGNINIL